MCGNIEGLFPHKNRYKVKFLEEKAIDEQICIIALVETHLKPQILDAEIKMKGYSCFRQDRALDIKKGGVCIYMIHELARTTEVISSGSIGNLEWITVLNYEFNLVLTSVYRPPVCELSSFIDFLARIEQDVSNFGSPEPTILVFGDFNFPIIDWSTKEIRSDGRPDRTQAVRLIEFMDRQLLEQLVITPTRENNILDLVLTNNDEVVNDIRVEYTKISDHRLVVMNSNIKCVPKKALETETSLKV